MTYGRSVLVLSALLVTVACSDPEPRLTQANAAESDAVRTWLDTFDKPATVQDSANVQAPPVSEMIDGLVAKLERDPNDQKGWALLARSYEFIGDHERARAAAARATALSTDADDTAVVAMGDATRAN